MAYVDALLEAQRQIKLRDYGIGALLGILAIALWGWQNSQASIVVDVRPGIQQRQTVTPGQMPAENVFNFALTLLQQLYRWETNGETEYAANIEGMRYYLTDNCKSLLLADAAQRRNAGELGSRTRRWEPMTGAYFTPDRVKQMDANTWQVTLDALLTETVNGQTVKEGFYRYETYVQPTNADAGTNPYGLLLNCYAPGSPSKIEKTATGVTP